MKDKKGFTLFEFILVFIIIFVVILISMPLLLYAIKSARINAFKASAYSVLDSAEYYIARTGYVDIPSSGIEIQELDIDLKNNNFDAGIMKETSKNHLELVYLKKNNYCAMGTKENLRATDEGCGALDTTAPIQAYVYLKTTTSNSLTVAVSVEEKESQIVSYEYSIDGKNYAVSNSNEYVFDNLKNKVHQVKVRVTNEAGLQKESDIYTFETSSIKTIECSEANQKTGFKVSVDYVCKYPSGNDYTYEYSFDNKNWESIILSDNMYTFHLEENKVMYTRIRKENKIVAFTTLNTSNIDKTLNGATPELLENMIPVVFDETNKIWRKADPRIPYFDYENKKWANAVLVRKNAVTDDPKSKDREYYLSNSAIGEEIYEKDILGFYVWIPKFQYQLFNVSNKLSKPDTIQIQFTTENKDDPKQNGTWYTHPAFSTNTEEYHGFWVSKFQNSAGKESSCYLTKEVSSCNIKNLNLYSLPNSNSITNVSISTASLMSNSMVERNNIYGLNSDSSAHVLTNLEWGAIAYLTNSKYGVNQNLSYENINYLNNLSSSTTGNITGVFDMAGTLSEMVMANYNQDAGKDKKNHSGFKDFGTVDWPSRIDYYNGITYKNRLLGDATGETIGWYDAIYEFVNGEYPFMVRGGTMKNQASIYNFSNTTGSPNESFTFRVVLDE